MRIEDNELVVSSHGGRLYRLDPSRCKQKQVFSSRQMELAVGDKLRWSGGSNKKKGQINGKQVTVRAIDNLSVTVEDNKGQIQQVSLLQPLPLDHNLVSTSYRAQGKSKKRVIVSATSDPTSSLEPFYVKISRQTEQLKVYTENLDSLRDWVQKSNAQENPLELIEQTYGKSPNTRGHSLSPETTTDQDREYRTANSRKSEEVYRNNSIGTESIHPGIDRTAEQSQEQRFRGIDERVNSVNEIAANHDREFSDALISRGRITLQGLEKLADAISDTREENSLIEALEQTQELIQQFNQDLQIQKLDALSRAIEIKPSPAFKFKGMEQLASAIGDTQITEAIAQTMGKFNQTVEQIQQGIQQKLDAISDSLSICQATASNPQLTELISSFENQHRSGAFWQPIYNENQKPQHLEQHHWEEFKQSAIHPDLASLNAVSLEGYTSHEYLLYDLPRQDRLNPGTIRSGLMKRYSHLEDGGWWSNAGTDALSLQNIQAGEKPEESPWGCFKPDNPRVDFKKSEERGNTKHIKYETPPKTERVPFLPEVSEAIAEKSIKNME